MVPRAWTKLRRKRQRQSRRKALQRSIILESLEGRLLLANDLAQFVVYAKGEVKLDQNGHILAGTIAAEEKVDIDKDASTKGLAGGDKLDLDKDAVVDGGITFNDEIDIHKNAAVDGSIDGGNKIKIDKDSTINGDITSADKIELKSGVTVTGNVVEYGSPLPFTPISLPPTTSFDTNSNDISTVDEATTTFVPGVYGEIDLDKDNVLNLTSGQYYFDEFKAKARLQLNLDVSGGEIAIFVAGDVKLEKELAVDITGGDASLVFLETHGKFELKKDSQWEGTIYAPFDKVKLESDAVVVGSLFSGERIDLHKNLQAELAVAGRFISPPELLVGLSDDTGVSATDGITADPSVMGSASDEYDVVEFAFSIPELSAGPFDITSQLGADGTFSLDRTDLENLLTDPLGDGTYTFRFNARDLFDNEAVVDLEVVLDTLSEAPAINSVTDDTGASDTDGVTNDNMTLVFTGTAEAGSTVTLNTTSSSGLGTATADGLGNWTFEFLATLTDGVFSFTATAEDLAGNISVLSEAFDVIIDTVAPAAPVITGIDQDTGAVSSDGVTNDNTLFINGTAEADSVVAVSEAGAGLLGTVVADANGDWAFDYTEVSLSDGAYSFNATATDLAGNVSVVSAAISVTVDTQTPPSPDFDLDPAFDSPPGGDQTTSFDTVTLTGSTESNADVELLSLGARTTSDSNGDFFFAGIPLSLGANDFTVRATDLAGNLSESSTTITRVPSGPDETPPDLQAALDNDTGFRDFDGITTDPTITGTVSDASPITLYFEIFVEELGSYFDDDITSLVATDGSFTIPPTFLESLIGQPLPGGVYEVLIEATDLAGNVSSVELLTGQVADDGVDTLRPLLTVGLANDNGADNSDGVTSDPTIAGTVYEQSDFTLYFEVYVSEIRDFFFVDDIADLVDPADGSFVLDQTFLETLMGQPVVPSAYFVYMEAEDIDGRFASDFFDFVLDVPPPPPFDLGISEDTGADPADGVTNDNMLVVSGRATASSTVTLSEQRLGEVGSTTADSSGDWSLDLAGTTLSDGQYVFSAVAQLGTDPSAPSGDLVVIVDTVSPAEPLVNLDPAFDTGTLGDLETTFSSVTVIGTAEPGVQVVLTQTGQSVTADANGDFSMTGVPLQLGRHEYVFQAIDLAGNIAENSAFIARDFPITLSEGSGLLSEASLEIDLGQGDGTRAISFLVDASFDTSASAAIEDMLLVYLVDPNDSSITLLDRGEPGTALFALAGSQVEYRPGLVTFDGSRVAIDVSSLGSLTTARLLLQLVDSDADIGTTVTLSGFSNDQQPDDVPNPVFSRSARVGEPGSNMDLSTLTGSTGIDVTVQNVRVDSSAERYTAELRVTNSGLETGRRVAVVFNGLPAGVELLNRSGEDAAGAPYVNMQSAIAPGGLPAGGVSDFVRIEFDDPTLAAFSLTPVVLDGGPNQAPNLDPVGALTLFPGQRVEIPLSASDPDNDSIYYRLQADGDLPNTTLTADGRLIIAPTPDQVGVYQFTLIATDGALTSSQVVDLEVIADPVTTTRISGSVLNTDSQPLVGIPIELGAAQTTTAADGTFLLEFAGALPDDTLKIRGESFAGPEVYPFIAEKLVLLLGHDAFENVNNFIARPIYLPALDIANAVTIDPAVDTTVTTTAIPGASVFVSAGSLEDQVGNPFSGDMSITEVPVDLTPAALPQDQFPDIVITIQPGEMVFTTPAPLTMPNLAGYLPGSTLNLWSINPVTGLFDNVGTGQVNADGTLVETISGGINNSSWHFFSPNGPTPNDPNDDPHNQDKDCDDCEEKDSPNSDAPPDSGSGPDSGGGGSDGPSNENGSSPGDGSNPNKSSDSNPGSASGSGSESGNGGGEPFRQPDCFDCEPGAWPPRPEPAPSGSSSGGGGGGGGGPMRMTIPTDQTAGGGRISLGNGGGGTTFVSGGGATARSGGGLSVQTSGNGFASNAAPQTGTQANSGNTQVALHSGAVYKSHDLTPYLSLQTWRGLTLYYDSERADPRPIVHVGFNNVQSNFPDPVLVSKLAISRGNFTFEVPGYEGGASGLTGGEHFFDIPSGVASIDASLQVDLRSQPSGVYSFASTNRFARSAGGRFVGTASTAEGQVVHVNSMDSPFGAGWGLAGLTELVENPDGSVLLIDGDGGERLFKPPAAAGDPYDAPAGDFSSLEKLPDGTFRRTHPDQTIEQFSATNKIALIRDRNGNETRYVYDISDRLEKIIDPVNLETVFRYSGGMVTEIEDPAGRITRLIYDQGNLIRIEDPDTEARQFDYDGQHRLTAEVDKRGHRESLGYDFAGRIADVTRKDGSRVQYQPAQTKALYRPDQTTQLAALVPANSLGSKATADRVDANGNVTRTTLDKAGQLADASDGTGKLPAVDRDDENLIQRATDGRGNPTLIKYDDRGNITSISDVVSRGAATVPLFADILFGVDRNPIQVAAGDVNSDGFADAVTANWWGDSVSVLTGDGSGSFAFRTDYFVNDPRSLKLVDINNDAVTDIVTANQNDTVAVLLGNGDGTFAAAVTFAAGDNPNFVEVADFDEDGSLDLVTANNNGDSVSVLLGDGTGGFAAQTSFAVALDPASVAVADINNDGDVDVVTANNRTTNNLSILLGAGDGTLGSRVDLTISGTSLESVALADTNDDGHIDILTTQGGQFFYVLFGNGDGSFAASAEYPLVTGGGGGTFPPFNSQLTVTDVDTDGDVDVLVVERSPDLVSVFTNDGRGVFSLSDSFGVVDGPVSVASSDLNLDGNADVVALGNASESIVAVLGLGDGTFKHLPQSPPNVAVGDRPVVLDLVDVNNDARPDVVTANQNDNNVAVLLGVGDGSVIAAGTYAAGSGPVFVASGDLNGDGNVDLVAANQGVDTLSVLFGDGLGAFAAPVALAVADGPTEIVIADLNADDSLDIVTTGNRTGDATFSVLLNNGDGTFAAAVNTVSNFGAATLDVGDLNGDDIPDLIVGNAAFSFSNRVQVRIGTGDGTFGPGTNWPFGGSGFFPGAPSQVMLADVNDDGDLDIVGTDGSSDTARVLIGRGDATFESVVAYSVGDSPQSLDVGDVDGDGIVDILAVNASSRTVSLLRGFGDGTFGNRADFAVGAGPTWLELADMDGDDSLDFVVANRDGDSISVRVNTTDGSNATARTMEYDPVFSQLTRSVDEQGRQILFDIDPSNGNTLSITEVIGDVGGGDDIVTAFTYTAQGLLDTMTDPLGRVMDLDYDAIGRLERVTYAVGTSEEAFELYEYDAAGNPTAVVDELGHRTEYVYDALNRLTQVTEADPDGAGPLTSPVTTYDYDAHGNLELVTDALSNTAEFVYDDQHRVIEAIDATGKSVLYTYDNSGNVVSVVDRLGRQTRFVYDDRNRMVETINADGGRERRFYDPDNNVIRIVDENNNPTTYVYDARNRLNRVLNAIGGVIAYEYDRVDNIRALSDELGRRSEMTYDELNREVTRTLPDPDGAGPQSSPVTRMVYDDASNLRFVTDPLDNTTEFVYDNRDRLITHIDADPDGAGPLQRPVTSFAYDDANRLIQVTDPLNRVTTFAYDDLNRTAQETYPDPDGPGPDTSPVMTYTYDAVDNELSMTDALGNVTQYEYDDLYRVERIINADPDGPGPLASPITTFAYDAEDQLISVSDPLNRVTAFEYDDLGRIIRELDPDPDGAGPDTSPIMTYAYDGVGNELSMTDALGKVTRFEYDDIYRRTHIVEEDPDGAGPATHPVTTYAYDAAHQLLAATDAIGRTTSYEYDDLGRMITSVHPDPDGAGPDSSPVMKYTFDLVNNQTAMTDALGNVTRYEYDNLYRAIRLIEEDPDGAGPDTNPITTFAYDVASQLTSVTDALGRTTTYEYDDLSRVVRRTLPDPDGAGPLASPQMTYTFDLMNNELSMTDALGNVTEYEYDNLYRLTRSIAEDPDDAGPQGNPTNTFVYDVASQLTAASDPLGRTTVFAYDDLGRIVRETYPDPDGAGPLAAPEMTRAYDLMDNEILMTDPLGHARQYEYDNLYRIITVTEEDPDGAGPLTSPTSRYTYDLVDQVLSFSDPLERTTTREYDNLGRMVKLTEPDPDGPGPLAAPVTTYVFDLMNNEIAMTDPLGHQTQYEYDNLYRLTRRIDEDLDGPGPLGRPETVFAYDLTDNLLSLTDTLGNLTSYSYDDLDRRIAETIELGPGNFQSRLYEYDPMNNLVRRTDRNDRVIEYDYDRLYRIVGERWLDAVGSVEHAMHFEFDEAAQLLSSEDPTVGSRYEYAYDGLGRVTQTNIDNGGPIVLLNQTFDVNSRLTEQWATIDGGADFRTLYAYDRLNRLTQLQQTSQPAGGAVADKRVDIAFNAANQFTGMARYDDLAGGAASEVSVTTMGYDGIGRLSQLTHVHAGIAFADYDLTFDAASRITQVVSLADGTSDYVFDDVNQLTVATHDFQTDEAYDYDENGNRTSAGYATGFYNRLTSDGIFNYEYDDEGNRVNRTDISTGNVTEYVWDHRNRLVSVVQRDFDGGPVTHRVNHRYDVSNQWISKDVDADGDGPGLSERTEYISDSGQIILQFDDAGNLTNRYLWGPMVDLLLADEQIGNELLWAHPDHLGTIRDLLDSDGNVANHITYDAFGNITGETNAAVDELFRFTGRALDEDTGLQNNLNRWYDPLVGRFASEDPIGFGGEDANLFRYVGNSPLNHTDPTGYILDDLKAGYEFSRGFADGVGQGVENFVVDTKSMIQSAGDWTAYVATGTAAGAVRIGEFVNMNLFGGSPFSTDEHLLNTARNIGGNSKSISSVANGMEMLKAMSPGEMLDLAKGVADALGGAAKDWFDDLMDKIDKGCHYEAGKQLGEFVGEMLPELIGSLGAKAAAKLGKEGLKDALIKFLKDERGSFDLEKTLSAFGGRKKPRAPRPGKDIDVDVDGMVRPTDPPTGASTFGDVDEAPLTGHYHDLPEGSEIPDGLTITPDGSDVGGPHRPTHQTISPSEPMSFDDFVNLFEGLPWQYGGKK